MGRDAATGRDAAVERAAAAGGFDAGGLGADEVVDALLDLHPGAASFVWRDRPIRWYRHDLARDEFDDLHVVGGPRGLRWQALSTDGTVRGAAERVAGEDAADLERETGVDVRTILAYRDAVAAGGDVGALVLTTPRGYTPWVVADGNHRATARALHLLETGEYDPQPAFLAVTANPVLKPLYERLGGVLHRVLRRGPVGKRGPDRETGAERGQGPDVDT